MAAEGEASCGPSPEVFAPGCPTTGQLGKDMDASSQDNPQVENVTDMTDLSKKDEATSNGAFCVLRYVEQIPDFICLAGWYSGLTRIRVALSLSHHSAVEACW